MWEADRVAFIDNWIVDADTPSRTANLSWEAISKRAADENKRKYALVAEKLRGPITPLVCSTDSGVHVKYAAFHCRLAAKWDRPYSRVLGSHEIAVRDHPCVDLRLRGRCRRLFGLSVADGLGPVV